MRQNTVSIIIPLYNAESYIVETINSVLKQTYKTTEIIIIDDHSTDASYEIALKYQSDRIIVAKNPRKGSCTARNYGFQLSSGDYIQYLDADDLLSPNKIEGQMLLAKQHDVNTIYSCKWLSFISDFKTAIYREQKIDKNYPETYIWLKDSWLGCGMAANSVWLTHRSLIERTNGWNESLLINQDGEFFSRILLNANQIRFSDVGQVYYRRGNSNSISQAQKYEKEKAASLLKSYSLYKDSAIKYGKLEELKEGLAQNFLMFIYQFYSFYPKLIENAENEFHDLGFDEMWPVGGKRFKKLSAVIGFKNALQLKKHVRVR